MKQRDIVTRLVPYKFPIPVKHHKEQLFIKQKKQQKFTNAQKKKKPEQRKPIQWQRPKYASLKLFYKLKLLWEKF